ncbi:cyclic GMP-AMP synthase-like isoform X2 [Malaclemys terrapin pileata]|uniref:cyclic GMP-AMP synthase-like isoform X2 n=1 Tax=Malaclemys terrapin pileata TaxID=2991368 RepID=UPI0023A8625D|nr:cyclic GMP-AMP synthase-like isoform X2 [Malaclemys terrapin pileata]
MSKPIPSARTKQGEVPQRKAGESRGRNSKADEGTESPGVMDAQSVSQAAEFAVTTSGSKLRAPEAPSNQDSECSQQPSKTCLQLSRAGSAKPTDESGGVTSEVPETMPAKSRSKQSNRAPECAKERKIPQRTARGGRGKGAQDEEGIEGSETAAILSPSAPEQLSAHCPRPKQTGSTQGRRESAGHLGQLYSRSTSADLCESSEMAAAALAMPSQDVVLRIKKRAKALTLKQEEINKAARIFNGFINPFIRYLKESPERPYFKEVTKLTTGSYYEFVKIDHPDEFDVMLALPVRSCMYTEVDDWNGLYYKVTLRRQTRSFPTPFLLEDGNTVSPVKVLEEFRKHVSQFTLSYEEVWRISLSHIEKEILNNHGNTKTCCESYHTKCCRKTCIRLLKSLFKDLKKDYPRQLSHLCSYYAKTSFLHTLTQWKEDTDWKPSDIACCFLRVLDDFIQHVENTNLPHFFIPNCNLFYSFPPKDLKFLLERLREQKGNGLQVFAAHEE